MTQSSYTQTSSIPGSEASQDNAPQPSHGNRGGRVRRIGRGLVRTAVGAAFVAGVGYAVNNATEGKTDDLERRSRPPAAAPELDKKALQEKADADEQRRQQDRIFYDTTTTAPALEQNPTGPIDPNVDNDGNNLGQSVDQTTAGSDVATDNDAHAYPE